MYLPYIPDHKIEEFIQTIECPKASIIVVEDSKERNYVDVYTNRLYSIFHITDFECINTLTNKIYSREWRKFAIGVLDEVESNKSLGDEYINNLHGYLEQDTIYGPVL